MTDRYPPFRLDMGGSEPRGTLDLGPARTIPSGPGSAQPARRPSGWTVGRVVSVVVGTIASRSVLSV